MLKVFCSHLLQGFPLFAMLVVCGWPTRGLTQPTSTPFQKTTQPVPVPTFKTTSKRAELQLFPGVCYVAGCRIEGRVVRPSRFLQVRPKPSKRRNFMKAFRRFTRKGLKYAKVQVLWRGQSQITYTDRDGFFRVVFPTTVTQHQPHLPTTPPARIHTTRHQVPVHWPPWKKAHQSIPGIWPIQLILHSARGRSPRRRVYTASPIQGFVVAPISPQGLSVISDVDDTLIATHVVSKRKLLKTFLFKRFDQIHVFPGALEFLKQVLLSPSGFGGGTLHYVTGSPALIYDRLFRLFRLQQFPLGSLSMKYLRGKEAAGLSDHLGYKTKLIVELLQRYPKRKFLLLGDSGEKDPEIYAGIRKRFPHRIVAIFIHHVRNTPTTLPRFRGMVVFRSYADAMQQARNMGIITILPGKK